MAVYKPTYCYPYLESVDLTIPDGEKYFTCQIDTSNIKITGYRVELYNENNERIFPQNNSNKISPLSELNDTDGTLGLNGSELRFPFVQHWNPKIYPSYNAIYFKATNYVDYYQKTNGSVDLERAQIKNGCLNDKNGNPIFIDGSPLFVGDVFLLVNKLYKVTLDGAVEDSLGTNAIVYVKGGDINAGAILSYNGSEFVDASGSAWCDIAGNPLAISNNGKTYKWQITLYSGERGAKRTTNEKNGAIEIDYSAMADNEFNTVLTSGTILGSTADRIQGPISDKIYAKQWLQLLRKGSNGKWLQVGTRTYIESYSQSLGHIYPVSGDLRGFKNDDLKGENSATHFAVYKYSNDPNSITSQTSVDESINFVLTKFGASHVDGSYSYEVTGNAQIKEFNEKCIKEGSNPLCKISDDGTSGDYSGKSVLIWNKSGTTGTTGNPLTGYFTISFSLVNGITPKFVFDMAYAYRKVSSYIGKVFFVKGGSFANENIVSKAKAIGEQDVASLGIPIDFANEEPLEIYPDAKDKFHGEIFKNEKGKVYVSPFVGLQAGARLYVSDGTVIKAQTVDTTTWAVTYAAIAPASTSAYSSTNPLKYEIRTNFKSSDETPFYAYDTPRLVPWSEQALSVIGTNGYEFLLESMGQILTVPIIFSSEIHARYVHVTGQYLQAQNVSWTSYRWLLVDEYGQIIQDTGKQYDGLIETTFYGLDGPTLEEVEGGTALRNQYYIVLLVEDELGNSLALGMEIKVAIKPSSLPVVFSGEFNCKTQAVKLKIQDYGYPTLSQDEENKAVVLNSTDGVIYTNADSQKTGYVSINGKKGTLKAADQVGIPIEGAQLAHFFAKNTTEIADLSMAPKKLATNREGNIEFHTKFKLDANYCGEFFKYGVDVFDNFGKAKRLYLSLGLPNNFKTNFHESGNLQKKRRLIYCKVQCGEAAASLGGLELFQTPTNEAYWLQPKEWIEPTTGNLTQHTDFEYLDFVYPFVKNGDVVTEDKNYTNIDESINTKGQRNIGVCCLQETRQPSGQYNVWTDLKRIQVETPVGYRIVQTAEQATWNDSYYWVEGWDPNNDTLMERVKRHPSIEGKTFVVDCYMKNIDKFYNLDFSNDSKFEFSYLGMTKSGIWTIKDKINELGQITLRITDVTGG